MKHNKILFVCAANICRSPMAEYLLRDSLRKDGATGHSVVVRSAGTNDATGSDASDQALNVMRERGVDMSRHKARHISSEIVDWADLILCMERGHLDNLQGLFPDANGKLHLLTEYCSSSGDIIDPSGKSTRAFEECAERLDSLIAALLEKMKAN